MKPYLFHPAIILFFTGLSFGLEAQTIILKGVVKEEFQVKQGTIILYIPDGPENQGDL